MKSSAAGGSRFLFSPNNSPNLFWNRDNSRIQVRINLVAGHTSEKCFCCPNERSHRVAQAIRHQLPLVAVKCWLSRCMGSLDPPAKVVIAGVEHG